jgi:beta-glucosidase
MIRFFSFICLLLLLTTKISHAQHREQVKDLFMEESGGIILLKNHGGLLPLETSEIQSIALIGPGSKGLSGFLADSLLVYESRGVDVANDIMALDSSLVYIGQGVNGFSGKYYNNLSASGSPAVFKTDKFIDFYWEEKPPLEAIGSSAFSVQWDATLIPAHGPVKVKLIHNDGARLYLDGKVLIDAWEEGPIRTDSAWLNIEKGRSYNIQVDYFSASGPAMVKIGFSHIEEFLLRDALEKALRADVAVICAGQSYIFQPDGTRVPSYTLPAQSKLISKVLQVNPNVVVVLNTDSAVDIEDWVFDAPAIIMAWPPETHSTREIMEVLFGKVNPDAKLPFRWTMNENQNFETRFPFGFGMTYTTFGIGKLLMKRDSDNSGWTATVEVRNMGSRAGTETLQLHVRGPGGEKLGMAAYKRVTLFPGQKKVVPINMPYSLFESFDEDKGKHIIAPGKYTILAGTSAEDLKLQKTIEIKKQHIPLN